MKKTTVFASFSLISFFLVSLASACGGGEENPFGVNSELVTTAERPIALAVAPDGRLFYGEHQTGNIGIVTPEGELLPDPFVQVDVQIGIEWGLTGLTLDPDFDSNHYVYVYFTQLVDAGPPVIAKPVVVRYTDENNHGVDRKIIVEDMPETDPDHPGFNANGGIHFGPDGFLYITVGDYDVAEVAGMASYAQDLSTPIGKILRVSSEDGSAAPDNPFIDNPDADPRIFAYGFRQSFDFAFDPETGQLYGSDGTSAGTCEELNLISKGANYDWPEVGEFPFADCLFGEHAKGIHFFAKEGMEPGDFVSSVNVSALAFTSQKTDPLFGDSLLVCESETQLMRRLTLGGANLDQVLADDVVVKDCEMGIAVSPDGIIYYSNKEEIRRLIPQVPEADSS